MTVKVKTVHGTVETFTTGQYILGSKKELHPDLLDVKVYAGSRLIAHQARHFHWFYKKFLYKPVQQELQPEEATASETPAEAAR